MVMVAAAAAAVKLLQSCPTLCDPIDGSPSGSPSLAFSRPRILEWVAISFSYAGSDVLKLMKWEFPNRQDKKGKRRSH